MVPVRKLSRTSGRYSSPLRRLRTRAWNLPWATLARFARLRLTWATGTGPRDHKLIRWPFLEELAQKEIGERLGRFKVHVSRLIARASWIACG